MPSDIGLELVLVGALIVVLVAGFLLGRRWRKRPPPEEKPRREGLGARVSRLVGKDQPTDDDWRWLEEGLVRADAGPSASREIVTRVRERYAKGDDPAELLVAEIAGMFEGDADLRLPKRLSVVMVVGVNGTGKTTTIGKLAHRLGREGRKVALANSDTFRAAAGEQLDVWARRSGAELVAAQQRGSDPGAVAFDAIESAKARRRDVVIIDTAGRLHSKQPLMDELSKVRRVIEKAAGRAPDEVLLVLDATTGQNGIAQARAFLEAVDVTGIALTKLDGTAKGGIVLRIREELGVPVKLVGTGEAIDDLQPFDPKTFAESLVRG